MQLRLQLQQQLRLPKLLLLLMLTLLVAAPTLLMAAAPEASAGADPLTSQPLSPLTAPRLPRSGLVAADLGVLIAQGDPLSEAVALAYQRARGIPEANMIRLTMPALEPGNPDVISAEAFAQLKAAIDTQIPAQVQATLVTWAQPSRVRGPCSMGITSALAFGYHASLCGGCGRTLASAYFDSDSSRPYTDLGLRPSMMLGAPTLDAAKALIARGVAADGSQPTGTGYLVRTADAARSARYPDFQALPAAWTTAPGLALRYTDASGAPLEAASAQGINNQSDVLFYFTGINIVPLALSNRYLPGAAADHLTSFGGLLPRANGQMPATDWLFAGATASYGTVEEPCNFPDKFPHASVLVEHYLRGATLIEAYWKSVAWPGQGLFVGEPLARPWNQAPEAVIDGQALLVRSRSLRRNSLYRVDFRPHGDIGWTTLATLTAGQPRPISWRVPLPADTAGGHLRWVGPCPTRPVQSCMLAQSD